MRAVRAVARADLRLAARQGEQLLVSIGIPVLVLVFFSLVDVLPVGALGERHDVEVRAVDALFPRVLALAIMSSAMVSLGIATGFDRHYAVLKRLGATPLGRPRLIAGKLLGTTVVQLLQIVALTAVAVALGWRPDRFGAAPVAQVGLALAAAVFGSFAFAGIGLALAGRLPGLANLAACNALYLVLLLAGGVVLPADELPGVLAPVARLLPSGALAEAMSDAVLAGEVGPGARWLVLAVWAVAMPALAAATFRWE